MADSKRPQIFNIAAGQAFLPCLADNLLSPDMREPLFGSAPLEDYEILLPTRRAARDLAGLLVTKSAAQGHAALLLPHIRTLGDLDEDAPVAAAENIASLALPPAIEPMARHYHLLTLIRFWAEKSGQMEAGGLNPVKLSALAFDLERFLDQAQNEDLDWEKLPQLVPDELAENWQQTLEFLKIITQFWPQILADLGHMDPTARRNALLQHRRQAWSDTPPSHPVIAAGSTGSIRATADLLALVARLPQGAVILPGLDVTLSASDWQIVAHHVSHPQYALAQLLAHMDVTRDAVRPWPGSMAASRRADILGLALAPVESTAQWAYQIEAAEPPRPDNLHIIEAAEPRAEAGAIAVLMRAVLQKEDKTAALVTRDRNLARRVAAELKRWGIEVDDSAGQPLANRPGANFLRRLLACFEADFAPVELLALLKHPLAHVGETRIAHMRLVRSLEKYLLRGPRHTHAGKDGLAALEDALAHMGQRLDAKADAAGLGNLLARLRAAFVPLVNLHDPAHLAAHMDALWQVAAALMQTPEGETDLSAPAPETALLPLCQGEEGRALVQLCDRLRAQSETAGPVAMADWPALFDMWLYRQPVREAAPVNPRLMILGPLEARLMQADVMILGGLNEGSWPPLPETGPWLSRAMRAALGMSQPERQIGQAAHDFVQAAAANEIYLTRAQKVDGTPAVAARWWRRLETICGPLPADKGQIYLDWWHALDARMPPKPAAVPPAPCPPIAARPDRLSVTQIETLLHNPYEIYAKKILNLREWDAVDAPPSAAERGSFLHALFEQFIAAEAHQKPNAAQAFLDMAADMQATQPNGEALLTFWQARLEAVADWMAENEAMRADEVVTSHVECAGEMVLDVAGGPFTVSAKADRIDALSDGHFEIIDYKTGQAPAVSKVKSHEKPQLTLEAAILAQGGFIRAQAAADGATLKKKLTGTTSRLSYWQVNGRQPAAKITQIPLEDGLVEGAVDMVSQLIAAYRDENRAYHAHIRPGRDGGPYDHLARRSEWRRAGEADGQGGVSG